MVRARSLLVGLVLALGVGASAQLPPGFKMPSLWYNPALLMDNGVQKELNVSQPVSQKIMGVMMEQSMKMLPLMGGAMSGKMPTEAESKKMTPTIMDAFAKMQKACTDNLSPAQLTRLHQITLQSFGPKSLLDPKIGSQVGLNSVQTQKLQSALGQLGKQQQQAAMKLLHGGTAGNPAAAQGIMAQTRHESEAVLDSILTPSQKAKWKALQGKPIKLNGMAAMMGGG